MAGFRIEGDVSNNVAEVNTNKEMLVALAADEDNAGYATLTTETDAGTITGTRLMADLYATDDYRLECSADTSFFSEMFPGTALNTALWRTSVTTMTVTVGSGWLTLNAGNSNAINAIARVQSYRCFPLVGGATLYLEFTAQFGALLQAGNDCQLGFGFGSDTVATQPTDGAYFQCTTSSQFLCVVSRGGVLSTVDLTSQFGTLVGVNTSHTFSIGISDAGAHFWIDDVLVADIPRNAGEFGVVASPEQQILFRNSNVAALAAAQVIKIGQVSIELTDFATYKNWSDARAGAGDMGYQGPTGGTMGSTSNLTNNLAVGAGAAATNTTAAVGSGLGGQFTVQPTLGVPNDGIIQSYQVPLGSVTVPGKCLIIKGIKISSIVSSALTGGPVVYLWSLCYGHTSVSLATTETATSKAPRRVPLGIQAWAAAAALWTQSDREIYMPFTQPIVVQPGEFVQAVAKNIGTVTSAGTITATIAYDVGWE
jgi:hypothetical protein